MDQSDIPGPMSGTHPLAAWLNKLRRSVLARTPRPGIGYKLIETTTGYCQQIIPGNGGIGISRLLFKEMQDDYIVCRSWDGTTEGTADIFVAKPPKLRNSVTEETLDGIDFEYTYTVTGADAFVARTSTNQDDDTTETQKVVPRYILDDEIFAIPASTGIETVDVETVALIDLNVDARAWAAQSAEA